MKTYTFSCPINHNHSFKISFEGLLQAEIPNFSAVDLDRLLLTISLIIVYKNCFRHNKNIITAKYTHTLIVFIVIVITFISMKGGEVQKLFSNPTKCFERRERLSSEEFLISKGYRYYRKLGHQILVYLWSADEYNLSIMKKVYFKVE